MKITVPQDIFPKWTSVDSCPRACLLKTSTFPWVNIKWVKITLPQTSFLSELQLIEVHCASRWHQCSPNGPVTQWYNCFVMAKPQFLPEIADRGQLSQMHWVLMLCSKNSHKKSTSATFLPSDFPVLNIFIKFCNWLATQTSHQEESKDSVIGVDMSKAREEECDVRSHSFDQQEYIKNLFSSTWEEMHWLIDSNY